MTHLAKIRPTTLTPSGRLWKCVGTAVKDEYESPDDFFVSLLGRYQVMDSSMPLIGEHVEEDKQLITDMVMTKMAAVLLGVNAVPQPSSVKVN